MKVVMKFGGVCLTTGSGVRAATRIVEDSFNRGEKIVVVTSASTKLTDKLIEAATTAKTGKKKSITDFIEKLWSDYEALASQVVGKGPRREELKSRMQGMLSELTNMLSAVSYLKELTPRTMDLILSYGEAFPSMILHAALEEMNIPARMVPKGGAGIITDENFGNATPLRKVTAQKVKETLLPLLGEGLVPVVAGFIASTQDGVTTTLGRGGSDYTATLIGSSLRVDEILIWTDVDGLMTADPKIEPKAITIPSLSYEEAAEMVYFGAKAMHPKALEPAFEIGVPIRIKNIYNLSNEGTVIRGDGFPGGNGTVRALSLIKDVALLTISGAGMVGTPGVAAKAFALLGENNINILMISQGSSESNISLIIPRRSLEQAYGVLELSLLGTSLVRKLEYENDICVVAVIGGGMKGTLGVAARIFKAIAGAGVNVRMIAQGSSELNISFVVKEKEGEKAVRALHKEFSLGKSGR